ncbi:MAG: efflux RND transporter permease subunit, partial [Wenzhouxiangellaceae bacterium]
MLTDSGMRYRVTPRGEFSNVDQYRNLVIGDGLRLGDIAEVTYDSAERDYGRHLDRKYAIGVNILKESGANLVEVGRRTIEEVERIGAQPEMNGINLFFLENQADGVVSSLTDLRNAGLLGALLSLFVLYFFLRNVPMTLMVALAVPISITITLGVMYFIGISLNILSMMGLMLAVGMLVDNAVVVSESIATEREKNPGPEHVVAATERGVRSVALAVAAGTLTSAAVFLPNIFGEQTEISIFLSHVAIAIVVSLAVSLLLAQTLIPMIASRLKPPARQSRSPVLDAIRRRYQGTLRWTLLHRWKSAALIVLTFASIIIPAGMVETDMFPASEDRDLFLMYNLDGHYPLERVKRAVDRIEDYLYENQPELQIRSVYSYYNETGEAQSSILLTENSDDERSSKDIADEILANMPDIAIGRPSFDQNRNGGGEGVSVTLVGASSTRLRQLADEVIRLLAPIEGLKGVRLPQAPDERELQIRIDRERARLLGFDSAQIATTIAMALRGVNLREFQGEQSEVPVRIRFRDEDAGSPEALSGLLLTNADGRQVPVTALVDLVE